MFGDVALNDHQNFIIKRSKVAQGVAEMSVVVKPNEMNTMMQFSLVAPEL